MGLILIPLAIVVLALLALIPLSKNKNSDYHDAILLVNSLIGVVAAIFVLVWGGIVFSNIITKNTDYTRATNDKSKIERLLHENYNPDNLTAALDFNNRQKLTKAQNSTIMFKYWDYATYTDTIVIPNSKYLPTSKLNLDVTTDTVSTNN
ncbi:MAG: hypothetical protein M0R17_03580 [Candidatus Omnitrophica bacterium]|jgi:hypothetical protein|nr:hypothetical protein [Candidatus Omnitrophota bacterium]